jgi:hypothetical protein
MCVCGMCVGVCVCVVCVSVCVCVRIFCCKLGKMFTEIIISLIPVFGERVSSTKKSIDESVKDQGVVGCLFLIGKALSIIHLCPYSA